MISDVLSDAVFRIEEYERDFDCYQGDETFSAALDKVKRVMDAMRQALDCPDKTMADGMLRVIADLDVSMIDRYLSAANVIARRMQNTGEDWATATAHIATYLRRRAEHLEKSN